MTIKKIVSITRDEMNTYKKLVGYKGEKWPHTFLLTLWRHFDITDLTDKTHLLVEQQISYLRDIEVDQDYEISLIREAILAKETCEFWTYLLTIEKGGERYASCRSKLYVKSI